MSTADFSPSSSNPIVDLPIEFTTPPRRIDAKAPGVIRQFPADVIQNLHAELIARINPSRLERPQLEDRGELRSAILEIITRQRLPYSGVERDQLAEIVLQEIYGYGPLQSLIDDDTVGDILINTHSMVYVERKGVLEETNVRFQDREHLMAIIERIVSAVGRHVDESSPMVDARLRDGSRVNVIVPPLAIDGPLVSIRKFGKHPLGPQSLLNYKSVTPEMLEFILAAVKAKLSIIISGGTGAGKTTLLNILSTALGEKERIVTIEDSAELQLQGKHVARLETRPPNVEGKGEIRQRELVINALRMRPDRIILGEVRGAEAMDLLQAMNTGHEGSLATVHANSPREAITRLENMVLMGAATLPEKAIRKQIADAVQLFIQATRLSDGTRRITNITEVCGMQGDVLTTQEVFTFRKTGVDSQGKVHGVFRGSGVPPQCAHIVETAGIRLTQGIFDSYMEV